VLLFSPDLSLIFLILVLLPDLDFELSLLCQFPGLDFGFGPRSNVAVGCDSCASFTTVRLFVLCKVSVFYLGLACPSHVIVVFGSSSSA
jgi:hypothetical protein